MLGNYAIKKYDGFDISFKNSWDYIAEIREFTYRYFTLQNFNEEFTNNLSMIVSELLENAVKYGIEGIANLNIRNENDIINISVYNLAYKYDANKLLDYIKIINTTNNIEELFKEKIEKNFNTNKSELGFIKIKLECNNSIFSVEFKEEQNETGILLVKVIINGKNNKNI